MGNESLKGLSCPAVTELPMKLITNVGAGESLLALRILCVYLSLRASQAVCDADMACKKLGNSFIFHRAWILSNAAVTAASPTLSRSCKSPAASRTKKTSKRTSPSLLACILLYLLQVLVLV